MDSFTSLQSAFVHSTEPGARVPWVVPGFTILTLQHVSKFASFVSILCALTTMTT